MANDGIFEGKEPAIRDDPREEGGHHLSEFPCAFCGSRQLLMGYVDQPEDNYRVDLYCDNPGCDVREMSVIVERADEILNRADVQALEAVDKGNHAELGSDGSVAEVDPGGNLFRGADMSGGPLSIFERRTRDVEVFIKPKS